MAKKKQDREWVTASPQKKRLELNLRPTSSTPATAAHLLAELHQRYDQNDELGFQSRYQALQAQYPGTAAVSEAHYMAGLLALSNKNYGRALQSFDRCLENPRSQQASKALFAKAITYQRLNLREPSENLLRQVQSRYPKSAEAERAALELKIQEKRVQ